MGQLLIHLKLPAQLLTGWGINLSFKRIEHLTYNFGQIGINLRQSKILNLLLVNQNLLGIFQEDNLWC